MGIKLGFLFALVIIFGWVHTIYDVEDVVKKANSIARKVCMQNNNTFLKIGQ